MECHKLKNIQTVDLRSAAKEKILTSDAQFQLQSGRSHSKPKGQLVARITRDDELKNIAGTKETRSIMDKN